MKIKRKYDFIPLDPAEIDHVVELLSRDLSPESISGVLRSPPYGLANPHSGAHQLEKDLQRAWRDVTGGMSEIRSMSDYCHTDGLANYFARALARALAVLHEISKHSEFCVRIGKVVPIAYFEDPMEEMATALRAVSLHIATRNGDVLEGALATKGSELQAIKPIAELGKKFSTERGVRPKLRKTELYLELAEKHPTWSDRKIANEIYLLAPKQDDGKAPFYWSGRSALIDRASGRPVVEKHLIEQIRKAKASHLGARNRKVS